MPTPTYTTSCLQNKEIAKDVHELKFTKPEGFDFEAGQFVLFQVPDAVNHDDHQPRAYSIASAPEDDELIFCVRIVHEGRAGKWFSSVLKEGTEVEMQGPMGNFKLNKDNEKGYMFVATGVGISPFKSQLIHSINTSDNRPIDLIWCTYNEETCFWKEEFEQLAEEHSNFNFHLTLSEAPENWNGLCGRVQQIIPTIPGFNQRQIYICGNPAMTSDVKKLCLEEWGFEKGDVHVEGYI
ncbi:hypothetical protein KJ652_01025 [Patescibacteria group bacterium]|nr:hypothetical protein [Patescibacteria group bacterium]MBU1123153.1 hypothetical protein [Patescibacteria group bacterium]MBU1911756.1 hypothetical protein [Patescibacteria group bacterium]